MTSDANGPVLLASASPRRRRLIGWLGLACDMTSTDVDETLRPEFENDPEAFACLLADRKAMAAARADADTGTHASRRCVLGFDTIVVSDGRILGKPTSLDDARRMLGDLSGRTHEVITGVAILCPGEEAPRSFAVATPVLMQELDESAIDEWLADDEAMGCAGAYNIERHLASVEIDQCFQNVAGLPLCHLYRSLRRLPDSCGVPDRLDSPVAACDRARGVNCKLGPKLVKE